MSEVIDPAQAKLDIAFARVQAAFAHLKSVQARVLTNRTEISQQTVKSQMWTDSDREQNELQEEWRAAYRSFAEATRELARCVDYGPE